MSILMMQSTGASCGLFDLVDIGDRCVVLSIKEYRPGQKASHVLTSDSLTDLGSDDLYQCIYTTSA